MTRRSTPLSLGQSLTILIVVASAIFLFYNLYRYGLQAEYYPTGLTVGGVNVGGMTRGEAEQVLTERYINTPVILTHTNGTIELNPLDVEMKIDLETMLSQADDQRVQQDFWSGFWGFLWDRPIDVEMVALVSTYNNNALLRVLKTMALHFDEPAESPKPVPASLTFQVGNPGKESNMQATLKNVENALHRAVGRHANFVVEPVESERPDMALLSQLIVNHVQTFEGDMSVFVMDLGTRQEIAYQADIAMSGMDMLKVPIALEAFRLIDGRPSISQTALISDTLLGLGSEPANQLLNMIAGKNDDYLGADLTTQSLQQLGLENSYILASYDMPLRRGRDSFDTPANSRADFVAGATPNMQTTAEDMGMLLALLYYCAEEDTEALRLLYREELTQAECQMMLDTMATNQIGSLIEGGVPENTRVAHRHGWINHTHGDAGIVYTPGGDYVIVMFAHESNWLEWELSSPMLADIARATYNYFNFENPFVNGARAN